MFTIYDDHDDDSELFDNHHTNKVCCDCERSAEKR